MNFRTSEPSIYRKNAKEEKKLKLCSTENCKRVQKKDDDFLKTVKKI